MPLDFLDIAVRKKVLADIKSNENKERKAQSLKQFEIFQDRQHQFVVEYLKEQFSKKTVSQMPVISSINLAKRIVTKEASLYVDAPERSYEEGLDSDKEIADNIYEEMNFDAKMLKANQIFRLQNQCHLMFIPKAGKITCRVLMGHNIDVVPSDIDPEVAEAYILSSFDKSEYLNEGDENLSNPSRSGQFKQSRDGINQVTGDPDDYKASLERYAVWTKDLNFVMDGNAKIVSDLETIENPLKEFNLMPFVDISGEKDFEYFVRPGLSVTDFSVQYCGALSDLANTVKLQSYGQAYLKGDKSLMPENIVVGTNVVLKLPIDPDSKVETEFGFANPSPDLSGAIQYIEMILSSFLTSRGLDPSVVSGKGQAEKFNSGLDRLLSMIQRFEASKSDMEIFRYAEIKSFEIIKAWNNVLQNSELLDKENKLGKFSDNVELSINYREPQMIQSRGEQLDAIMKERELGLKSRIDALMELNGIGREAALEMAKEIDKDELLINGENQGTQAIGIGSQPDNKP